MSACVFDDTTSLLCDKNTDTYEDQTVNNLYALDLCIDCTVRGLEWAFEIWWRWDAPFHRYSARLEAGSIGKKSRRPRRTPEDDDTSLSTPIDSACASKVQ